MGSEDIDHFTRAPDLPSFRRELDAVEIDIAVMVGRSTPSVRISNDVLATLSRSPEGRLLGVGSVDPQLFAGRGAADEAERSLKELELAGVNVDPAFFFGGADLSRRRYVVSRLRSLRGHRRAGLHDVWPDDAGPTAQRSARRRSRRARFPEPSHRLLPRLLPANRRDDRRRLSKRECLVSPDMYLFAPGGLRYADAASGCLADQVLFGSSYPFRPLGQGVADFLRIDLDEEVIEKVAWRNAARLLRLDLA